MSLTDAKRMLQWKVVVEALAAAEVDAETQALVERARTIEDTVHTMARMLLGGTDAEKPKNYVKVEMLGMIPPFDRAYVELTRPGGKTSHELRELLRDRLAHVRYLLSKGCPSDELREGILQGIDQDLQAEEP